MTDFYFILPVHNQPGYTEFCIRSIYRNSGDYKLLVIANQVDNPTKKILQQLKKQFVFEIKYVEQNVCWAKAINIGIGKTLKKSRYTILLHNDCFIGKHFIEHLSLLNDIDPQIAAVIPRTNYSREHSLLVDSEIVQKFQQLKPGNKNPAYSMTEVVTLLKTIYGNFQEYAKPKAVSKQLTYCRIPDTYCLVVRSNVLADLPNFRENFITTGWCERLWHRKLEDCGYEIWILNGISVHHHGNLTTDGVGFNYGEDFQHDERLYQRILDGSNQNTTNS